MAQPPSPPVTAWMSQGGKVRGLLFARFCAVVLVCPRGFRLALWLSAEDLVRWLY